MKVTISAKTIAILLLFMCCMDFFGLHLFLFPVAGLLLLVSEQRPRITVSNTLILVLIWAIAYAIQIINENGITSSTLLLPVGIFFMYFMGLQETKETEAKTLRETFFRYFWIITAAVFLRGFLNIIINVIENGFSLNGQRELLDIWGGGVKFSATGQVALFIPIIGACYYIFAYGKEDLKTWQRVLLILAVLLSLLYNVMNATRYILYIFVVIMVFSALLSIFTEEGAKKYRPLVAVLITTVICLILYSVDFLSIRTTIQQTGLAERMERLRAAGRDTAFTSVDRVEQWGNVFANFNQYIWGGRPQYEFIHNTWLDELNRGGLLLFIPFLLVTIAVLVNTLKAAFRLKTKYALFLIGLLIAFYGYFFIEPVLSASRWLMYVFAFFAGQIDALTMETTEEPGFLREEEIEDEDSLVNDYSDR